MRCGGQCQSEANGTSTFRTAKEIRNDEEVEMMAKSIFLFGVWKIGTDKHTSIEHADTPTHRPNALHIPWNQLKTFLKEIALEHT